MFPGDRTLYSVLGVAPDAPAAVIKAAYRALAKQYHPDGQGVDGASTAKFIELQEAYKVLSDEPSRAEYDRATFGPGATSDNSIPDEQTEASIDPDEVWASKVSRRPELEDLHEALYTFSPALGNRFRLAVVGGECDDDPATFAAELDRAFFGKYFGDDPEVQGLARRLLESGNRRAAKALNKAVQKGRFKDSHHAKRLIGIFERLLNSDSKEQAGNSQGNQRKPAVNAESTEATPSIIKRSGFGVSRYFPSGLAFSIALSGLFFTVMGFTTTEAITALIRDPLQYSPFLISLLVINAMVWLLALSANKNAELREIVRQLAHLKDGSPDGSPNVSSDPQWWFVGSKYFWRFLAAGTAATLLFAIVMGFTTTAAIATLIRNPLGYSPFLLSLLLINSVAWLLALSAHRSAELRKSVSELVQTNGGIADAFDASQWGFVGSKYFWRSLVVGAAATVFFAMIMGFMSTKALAALFSNPLQYSPFLLSLLVINSVVWLLSLSAHRNADYRMIARALAGFTKSTPDAFNASQWRFVGSKYFWRSLGAGAAVTVIIAIITGFTTTEAIATLIRDPLRYSPFLISLFVINAVLWILALSSHRYRSINELLGSEKQRVSSLGVLRESWRNPIFIVGILFTLAAIALYSVNSLFVILTLLVAALSAFRVSQSYQRKLMHPRIATAVGAFGGALVILLGINFMFNSTSDSITIKQQDGDLASLAQTTRDATPEKVENARKIINDRIVGEQEVNVSTSSEIEEEVSSPSSDLETTDAQPGRADLWTLNRDGKSDVETEIDLTGNSDGGAGSTQLYPPIAFEKLPYDERPMSVDAEAETGKPESVTTISKQVSAEPIHVPKRVALVIGNAAYKRIPWLPNPDDDARAMAEALTAQGFEVTTVTDATLSAMRLSLFGFSRTLNSDVEAALVYYSGHAVEIDSVNYLLPTDTTEQGKNGIPINSISLSEVIQILDAGRVPIKILILDACRNNPLNGKGGGLATVRAGSGTFIAYSTEPGSVAVDGDPNASNSPYTAALVKALEDPASTIEETFRQVRTEVMRVTDDKQVPWESSSLMGGFSFKRLSQVSTDESRDAVDNIEAPDQPIQRQKQISDRIVGDQEIQGREIPLLPSAPEPPPLLLPSTGEQATQPAAEGTPSTPSSSTALPDEATPAPERKKRTIMDLFRGNGMDDASADQPETNVATVEQPKPSMPDSEEAAQPATGSGFVVQLASFRSEADARKEYSRLSSLYPSVIGGLQQQIRQTSVGGSTRYQLGLGPLGSRSEATQLCSALINAGESDCIVRGR